MEKELLEAYHRIFTGKGNEPDWAVHKAAPGREAELVHCPIPFVGKEYASQKTRILVYASAENLSRYNGYLDDDGFAINRHRRYFDASAPDRFFPNVHIQPFSNGYLPIIAFYVYLKYQDAARLTPAAFSERIAFANYGKYTIQPDAGENRNQDYAGSRRKLGQSHEYVRQDLGILRPDVIIMPASIYKADRAFVDENKGNAAILPIYQILPRTIASRKMIRRYAPADPGKLHPAVLDWYRHLKDGRTKDNFLSVFTYLDAVMEEAGL